MLPRNRRTWLHTASNGEEDEAKLVRIHLPEMEIFGAIEFKMDKKSYRMIPLANSEDYLYNKQSLKKANEVGDDLGCLETELSVFPLSFLLLCLFSPSLPPFLPPSLPSSFPPSDPLTLNPTLIAAFSLYPR